MDLTEWLEKEVDVSAAKRYPDMSLAQRVKINQELLASAYIAIETLDARLARVEAHLGFSPFEFPTKRHSL